MLWAGRMQNEDYQQRWGKRQQSLSCLEFHVWEVPKTLRSHCSNLLDLTSLANLRCFLQQLAFAHTLFIQPLITCMFVEMSFSHFDWWPAMLVDADEGSETSSSTSTSIIEAPLLGISWMPRFCTRGVLYESWAKRLQNNIQARFKIISGEVPVLAFPLGCF